MDGAGPSEPALVARPLRGEDFPRARAVVERWFGHPVGLVMHRLFFEQLGPSGVWMETAAGEPVGFLLGLVSEAEPDLAYVHMHAVDPAWRGRGVGRALYGAFCDRAAARGCRRVRALAAPERTGSVRFHERLGFAGRPAPGYLGPGQDRIVFERRLPLDAGGAPARAPIRSGPTRPEKGEPMADTAPGDERRAHPRADVELPVRVSAGGETVAGQSVNVSEGGILVAGADFPSGAQVRIEIELAEMGWHALDAEVVRRQDVSGEGTRLAARFAEVATEGGRQAIRAFFESRLAAREGTPGAGEER